MSKQVTENMLCRVNNLLGISDSYQAPDKMMQLLKNQAQRKKMFLKFLEVFDYDLSYEWFYIYFQEEHADRKNKKQDFTPVCVSRLMSEMFNEKQHKDGFDVIEEPAAGTGSTIIAHWYRELKKCTFPWDFRPDNYLYKLTELSDKTIPFLLFNLAIRGMNALVIHGNSLTKVVKNVFWLYNEKNDPMGFSDLYICPHTERIEKMFDIVFAENMKGKS